METTTTTNVVILGIWKLKDYIHSCYLLCLHIILYWLIVNWLDKFLDGCFYMWLYLLSHDPLYTLMLYKSWSLLTFAIAPHDQLERCFLRHALVLLQKLGNEKEVWVAAKAPEAAFVLDPPLASDFVPNTIATNERKLEESSESSSLRLERGILVYYDLGTNMQINKKSHNLMHWKILKEPDKSKLLLRLRQLSRVIW